MKELLPVARKVGLDVGAGRNRLVESCDSWRVLLQDVVDPAERVLVVDLLPDHEVGV